MVNQTLNNSLNSTPNDILIGLLPSSPQSSLLSDSNLFWISTVAIFIIVYLILGLFPSIKKSLRVLLSLSIPLLIDIAMSFGSFTFTFPLGYSITTTHGVMFIKLIDYIFTYGIFTDYSSSLISPFIEASSDQPTSLLIYVIVFLSVAIDSILEFAFFAFATYTIITLIENKWKKQIKNQLPISIFAGLVPVLFYTLLVSNPLKETNESVQALNGVTTFLSSSPFSDILIVFVIIIINFAIITEIIFLAVELMLSLYVKVNYARKDIEWTYEISGIALVYTFTYSFIFFLHSDFKWYVIFPILLVYANLKGKTSSYLRESKNRLNENQKISDITRQTIEEYKNPETRTEKAQSHDEFSYTNIIISALLIIAFILIYLWYTNK